MRESAPSLKLWLGFTDTAGECVRPLAFPTLTIPFFAPWTPSHPLPPILTLGSFSFKLFFSLFYKWWNTKQLLYKCMENELWLYYHPDQQTKASDMLRCIRAAQHHITTINKWKDAPCRSNYKACVQEMWSSCVFNVVWQMFNGDSSHKMPFFSCINLGMNVDVSDVFDMRHILTVD